METITTTTTQKKSQSKLTRTQSSLLNLTSSPTLRSSFQSLTSINDYYDEEDDKNNKKKIKKPQNRTGSTRITTPVIAVISFGFLGACSFFFYFSFLGSDEVPTSENLLLALIFIAVALYFASKNKRLINHGISVFKQWWEINVKRVGFGFGLSKSSESKPVQWFIGDSTTTTTTTTKKKSVREGVEFYSNGDFYEGEFHKGRSNGSGVYNYFVNGRYEGDWIDGRYDGYGIESWARGSRYKGQYRKGMRHGYGVYRFYTGDSFSGEWCNGQSHGMGLQTCSDASTYVGQFKLGVKHGLGCYHFRSVTFFFLLFYLFAFILNLNCFILRCFVMLCLCLILCIVLLMLLLYRRIMYVWIHGEFGRITLSDSIYAYSDYYSLIDDSGCS
jgi:hypothetical protein